MQIFISNLNFANHKFITVKCEKVAHNLCEIHARLNIKNNKN